MVCGDQYSLVSDESQEQIYKAAHVIDSLMQEIASKAPGAPLQKVAVLAALQCAITLLKLESTVARDEEKKKQIMAFIERECLSL